MFTVILLSSSGGPSRDLSYNLTPTKQ
jgi:hypothetical protein